MAGTYLHIEVYGSEAIFSEEMSLSGFVLAVTFMLSTVMKSNWLLITAVIFQWTSSVEHQHNN
jgi:energy-converting hydrogenase Eha subunit F